MDLDTIEVCWTILQQYVKKSDQQHAVSHLVSELLDAGLRDEDIRKLADLDDAFANVLEEYELEDIDDDWDYDDTD